MTYIVKPKKGFFNIENIDEENIGDFDQKGMSMHGINRNLQRNIALFFDNLKVVHRRLLYAMATRGLRPEKNHSKSAGVIGRTIELFHPHGDAAAYEALIFMGQPWRNIMSLVDIKGNYGNAEGPDEYAQMRYVEIRLSKFAWDCFFDEWDLKSNLVDMRPTFNNENMEPIYLPAKYPLFLMNWGSGMGFGLATSSPGFLPQDAMQTVIDLVKNPDAKILIYPEDPMGCTIIGKKIFQKFVDHKFEEDIEEDKKLKYRVRSDYIIDNGMIRILNTPYEVNPNTVIAKIKKLREEKKIDGILDMEVDLKAGKIPELSAKEDTMNIIIEYAKGIDPHILMDKLYKLTQLETTFSLNCVYVDMNKNVKFNLRESVLTWIKTRKKVLKRMYRTELTGKSKRNYVLDALIDLFEKDQIDNVIDIIRRNKEADISEILIAKYGISDYQAKNIGDMRLTKLSTDSYDKYVQERKENQIVIDKSKEILKTKGSIDQIIIDQMKTGIKRYSRIRQSKIIETNFGDKEEQFFDIDVIHSGTVRKTKHGSSIEFDNEEFRLIDRHVNIGDANKLFTFTNNGLIFSDLISNIRVSKESSLGGIISKRYDETKYTTIGSIVGKDSTPTNIICVTKFGLVKNSKFTDYFISSQGSYGIRLAKNDELVSVLEFTPNDIKNSKILIYTKSGKCGMFAVDDLTVTARFTMGNIGIKLEDDDYVIGAELVKSSDEYMVTVSESGHIKKFSIENTFNTMKRGSYGVSVVSSGEDLYKIATVGSKITKLLLVSLQRTEEVVLAELPTKTRLSSGDKILKARRKNEIILKEK
jgi:DNA gyrase subunit A